MTLDDLFLTTLKDIYFAERQLLKALPKMAKAAQSDQLKQAFTNHRDETEVQVERLQQVFEAVGKRAQGVTCEAIKGLIEECDELLDDATEPSPVRDAGLIACGQAVEHYEMARYGALVAWAKAAGKKDVAALLQATLDEEKKADTLLSQMATQGINMKAAKAA
ncbi:YciE/YciF ferroxidase family protein [Limobrevibacterium gyesilva]|uniref:Ferritin-like domain-containing protein n=1 Tax=Limobrevibacterium gyesilva TaxID=2991712 RepID=A0AA42CEZ3_9PROT|nr:ferritin-like domain-containing protein [Limobrevibacterium gyesilva]MCW3476643.1 ferritin-like domain-containing protein [Limobrevibacterium gyesilva]